MFVYAISTKLSHVDQICLINLQEALHREKMLEQKLSNLQELVQNTQESSEGGWQVGLNFTVINSFIY